MSKKRICGVELKGSEALLAVVEVTSLGLNFLDLETRKIALDSDDTTESIQSFYDTFSTFIHDNKINEVVIKKRQKSGRMRGGGDSFKMEALIQLCSDAPSHLFAPQTISAIEKSQGIIVPANIKKYQEIAFKTAYCYSQK